jgi:hypothetical protein
MGVLQYARADPPTRDSCDCVAARDANVKATCANTSPDVFMTHLVARSRGSEAANLSRMLRDGPQARQLDAP